MLSEDRKDKVRALSDEALELEVNRGRASVFQGDIYDFAKTELALRKEAKQKARESDSLALAHDGVKWQRWAVIVAVLTVAVTVALARCSGGT